MTFNNKNLIRAIIALAAIVGITTYMSNKLGQANGEKALARMQQVWPNVLDMPAQDRALLGSLSISCRLEDRPLQASATIDCLRQAMASNDVILPKGMDRASATQRLDQLLADRP